MMICVSFDRRDLMLVFDTRDHLFVCSTIVLWIDEITSCCLFVCLFATIMRYVPLRPFVPFDWINKLNRRSI
jgi:hypothetical protein